jgi:integrase/recombinase XerC
MVRVLRMLQVRGGQGSEQRRQRAPHLTEVLQKLSVKRFTATSCNGLRTLGEACRRGGALALRPRDLDPDQCLILLREKGETVRWQPVSPTLMARLTEHGQQRHAPPDGQLLRYATGRPITHRRYDHLWTRIGRHLPWVATQGISTHWIRHSVLTWVERNFGYAVAHAYAGHTDSGEAGATATYVRASLSEVAAALAALTGEAHPLAPTEGW